MLLLRAARPEEPADILFTDVADFSVQIERLRDMGIFENVAQIHSKQPITALLHKEKSARQAAVRNPFEILPFPNELAGMHYTDIWLNLDGMCPKMVYYGIVQNQKAVPAVHFVEEGNTSYYLGLTSLTRDPFDHFSYGNKSFDKNCEDLWLYDPEAYCSNGIALHTEQLPRDLLESETFISTVKNVFDAEEAPPERFIVFEQCFITDEAVTNDLELFKHIARTLGAENMSVRLHPRTKIDRFSPFGFHVVRPQGGLWEATLLSNRRSFAGKIFISVDSTATFSLSKLFGNEGTSLLLDRLVWGEYKGKDDPSKERYLDNLETEYNKDRMTLYRPTSMTELNIILDYLAERKEIHG